MASDSDLYSKTTKNNIAARKVELDRESISNLLYTLYGKDSNTTVGKRKSMILVLNDDDYKEKLLDIIIEKEYLQKYHAELKFEANRNLNYDIVLDRLEERIKQRFYQVEENIRQKYKVSITEICIRIIFQCMEKHRNDIENLLIKYNSWWTIFTSNKDELDINIREFELNKKYGVFIMGEGKFKTYKEGFTGKVNCSLNVTFNVYMCPSVKVDKLAMELNKERLYSMRRKVKEKKQKRNSLNDKPKVKPNFLTSSTDSYSSLTRSLEELESIKELKN